MARSLPIVAIDKKTKSDGWTCLFSMPRMLSLDPRMEKTIYSEMIQQQHSVFGRIPKWQQ
jgi:hypothetical protein